MADAHKPFEKHPAPVAPRPGTKPPDPVPAKPAPPAPIHAPDHEPPNPAVAHDPLMIAGDDRAVLARQTAAQAAVKADAAAETQRLADETAARAANDAAK